VAVRHAELSVDAPRSPSAAAAIRRRLVRGSATVFIGMTAGTLLTLLVNAILARILGHDRLGAYFLVFSLVTFGTTISQLGLDRTVVRLISASLGTGLPGRARRAILVAFALGSIGAGAVALTLVLGLGDFLAERVYHSDAVAGAITLAAVWIILNALLSLAGETFRGFQRFWPATLFSGLAVDVLLAVGFGSLWLAGARPSLNQAVAVSAGASAIALFVAIAMLVRPVSALSGPGTVRVRKVASISIPLLGTAIASFMLGTGVDLWVVGHFRPASDVALYGAASRLVFFVATPLIVVSQVVPPIVAELYARGERRQLEQSLRNVSTITGIPAAIVLIAFLVAGGPIMGAIYGPGFAAGATVLAILSVSRLVAVATGSSGTTLMMTGHQRTMFGITLLSGVSALTGEILLAPDYGITGVAVATSCAQVAQNLLQLGFARFHVGIWTHARLSLSPVIELIRG
jgi:O-antigen/teichoic acid export membrane protein